MNRRKILGFLGGAAVAGPSMAKAAAVQGIDALSLGGIGQAGTIISGGYGVANPAGSGPVDGDYNPLAWARKDLARFLGKTTEQLLREKNGIQVMALDPDLAAMRAISLDAKVRIQRDRIHKRNQEQERDWIEQRINDLLNPLTD